MPWFDCSVCVCVCVFLLAYVLACVFLSTVCFASQFPSFPSIVASRSQAHPPFTHVRFNVIARVMQTGVLLDAVRIGYDVAVAEAGHFLNGTHAAIIKDADSSMVIVHSSEKEPVLFVAR